MSMAVNFAEKVFAFTGENALFSAPCHVLVGVSGGADSMALLHLLTHWPEPGMRVSAVHIHHGLRGELADRDEKFVRYYCEKQDIPLMVYRENVAAFACREGLTVEEAGRQVRYADFERCRLEIGADFILTAHTASDQVETVLMRLIRGTGPDGLAGIPFARGCIRRPLLVCSREEVETYCRDNHLEFVTDETNADVAFTRNRIRHEVMPLLRQINPSVDEAIQRLCSHVSTDVVYWNELANTYVSSDTSCSATDLADLPAPIRRRVISRLFTQAGVRSYDQCHLLAAEHIILKGNGAVRLPSGITLSVSASKTLQFSHTAPKEKDFIEPILLKNPPCSFKINENVYHLSVTDAPPIENVHNLFSKTAVDYDKIQGDLYVRSRQEGDTLHPAGRGIGKSVKKLMNEYKIAADQRDLLPLLCDDLGVVLIPGYSCDERVKITSDTKHFLVWNTHTEQG